MNLYEGNMALQEMKIILDKDKLTRRDRTRMGILVLRVSRTFNEINDFQKNVAQITELYDNIVTSVKVEPQREVRNKRRK